jgi:hypothetical protein
MKRKDVQREVLSAIPNNGMGVPLNPDAVRAALKAGFTKISDYDPAWLAANNIPTGKLH